MQLGVGFFNLLANYIFCFGSEDVGCSSERREVRRSERVVGDRHGDQPGVQPGQWLPRRDHGGR